MSSEITKETTVDLCRGIVTAKIEVRKDGHLSMEFFKIHHDKLNFFTGTKEARKLAAAIIESCDFMDNLATAKKL